MKPFYLYFQFINNVFLLVPEAVLVIMDNPLHFLDFLSFSKYIYSPFKIMSKGTDWDVCNSKNKFAYH